jgi:YHS domain-containing protein
MFDSQSGMQSMQKPSDAYIRKDGPIYDETSTQGPSSAGTSRTTSEASVPSQLPEGWSTMVSTTTGKTYYYNQDTGESSFTLPKARELPPGWKEVRSRTTGKVYYWNSALKKNQFEFPKA